MAVIKELKTCELPGIYQLGRRWLAVISSEQNAFIRSATVDSLGTTQQQRDHPEAAGLTSDSPCRRYPMRAGMACCSASVSAPSALCAEY